MLSQLLDAVRTFSHPAMSLKSNIVAPGGVRSTSGGRTSGNSVGEGVGGRMLSGYYSAIQELGEYEYTDISRTIVSIYEDFIVPYINTSSTLIELSTEVPNYAVKQERLNKIAAELDLVKEVKDHLWDIIYMGSYSFKVSYDEESQKYKKEYLHNPRNVVTVKRDGKVLLHLVTSKGGQIYTTKPDSIFRIGQASLDLVNDVNDEFLGKVDDDSLVRTDQMVGSLPLYYYMIPKIKEFLLKEQLLSLLSIKDLIQPLLLLIRLDKNTSPDEGNKIALNVEKMINKHSDLATLMSSKYGVNQLLETVMNNIRVLPDYQSAMGDMNNVDMSKITSKIQEIENTQEMKKESIYSANSIPRALFTGETTKWEAIKSSQRLQSKVNNLIKSITMSVSSEMARIYEDIYGSKLDPDLITVNLFSRTEIDYNNSLTNIDIASQMMQGITQILQTTQQFMTEVKIIEPTQFAGYMLSKLKEIDPDIESFVNSKTIESAVKAIQAQQAQAEGGG